MNNEDVIRIAREVGFVVFDGGDVSDSAKTCDAAFRFAQAMYRLGANEERRACELLCAEVADDERGTSNHIEGWWWAEECINSIRTRNSQ